MSEQMKSQIRGSMLLVMGRGISLFLNLLTQVLCVRYLSKTDYGSFAYAIAMIELLSLLSTLGFEKSLPRFAAIYEVKKDSSRFVGLVVTAFGLSVAFGVSMIAAGFVFVDGWSGLINANPLAVQLLLILMVLAPINAIDALMVGLFGVFSGAKHIFLRRHIVRPGLRLAAVLFVMFMEGDSRDLAISYVVVGFFGVAVFLGVFYRILMNTELVKSWDRKIEIPARDTFLYNAPILTTDLVFIFRGAMIVFLLEYFHDARDVADFQSVLPFGRLVEIVLINFGILFVPAISRAFAAEDRQGLASTFISTQTWVSLLSYPLFALVFGFADVLTPLLFGQAYISASEVLAWLAVGFYIRVVFGLAPRTLKVLGYLREVLWLDAITVVFALLFSLWVIPAYGAVGAAISASVTMVFHALCNQLVLYRKTGIGLWDEDSRGLYLFIGSSIFGLAILRWVLGADQWLSGLVSISLAVVAMAGFRKQLSLLTNFPEIRSLLKSIGFEPRN